MKRIVAIAALLFGGLQAAHADGIKIIDPTYKPFTVALEIMAAEVRVVEPKYVELIPNLDDDDLPAIGWAVDEQGWRIGWRVGATQQMVYESDNETAQAWALYLVCQWRGALKVRSIWHYDFEEIAQCMYDHMTPLALLQFFRNNETSEKFMAQVKSTSLAEIATLPDEAVEIEFMQLYLEDRKH